MKAHELGPPSIDALLRLIAALRADDGCPWDRKQTPDSLSVYLIEEMYELVEAIAADDPDAVLEELGDVLFQVLFVAFLYEQAHRFSLRQVLERIIGKMVHRHPHVFGTQKLETAGEVKEQWRRIKQQEKGVSHSLLDSVPAGMPALMRAYRISERAAGTGFDWEDLAGVMNQAVKEWTEFKAEIESTGTPGIDKSRASMEFGDVLFTLVNVARIAGIHPETALARSTEKFIQRFNWMEAMAAEKNHSLESLTRTEMERLWDAAKKAGLPAND